MYKLYDKTKAWFAIVISLSPLFESYKQRISGSVCLLFMQIVLVEQFSYSRKKVKGPNIHLDIYGSLLETWLLISPE